MYKKPPFIVAKVANPLLNVLVRLGLSPAGAQTLIVRGRRSGEERRTPVNPLDFAGSRYLVAPRGTTHWVRNLEASGEGWLQTGSRRRHFTASQVAVDERAPILRAYLDRWGKVTKGEFGVRGDETEAELAGIAADHPVFRIEEHA